MRGEHIARHRVGMPYMGSSPHARGARTVTIDSGVSYGIIPACAGSTIWQLGPFPTSWDHPRMRGEHGATRQNLWTNPGSSPHARGAPDSLRERIAPQGIIPACAGSTQRLSRRIWSPRDHPRMRGEHVCAVSCAASAKGSSPHARGAHLVPRQGRERDGIIPACAGSTFNVTHNADGTGDHPRMRGEHPLFVSVTPFSVGSSPHARGAHRDAVHRSRIQGIIPACAGSTRRMEATTGIRRDHPRMRGEHEVMSASDAMDKGSSPHARGALADFMGEVDAQGIIPACAGSTTRAPIRRRSPWDHPRMRGEHLST